MADNRISMPAGFGGLMRFDEEYKSKIMLQPIHIVAFVILIILFRVFLGFWFG
ncbi:MAG: preprotein translocase subunit Sec61beta [Nanoarchaeota archaeon]|nr:preprotein translocase subunit Sec61beta [Nanoarchaeota archaeon]